MQEKQITLDQYAAEIVRPMIIKGIKSGRFDDVLGDPDVLRIILKDKEALNALEERINYLAEKRKERHKLLFDKSNSFVSNLLEKKDYKVGSKLRIRLPFK